MITSIKLVFISVLFFLLIFVQIAEAQIKIPKEDFEAPKKEYSPYMDDYYPRNVYFGDTHLHTSWSYDAGLVGATMGPEEAYRASRGEEVVTQSGQRFKLIRPLDFLVVADHAENIGLAELIRRSDPLILANKKGKEWHDLVKAGNGYAAFLEFLRAENVDLINEPHIARAV